MILLLDADKGAIHYCLRHNDRTLEEGQEQDTGLLKEKLCRLNKYDEISRVGYRLQNGPAVFNRSVMELTPLLAAHIGETPCFGPNPDQWAKELFNFCSKHFKSSRHFILCDSVFFLNMPEYAKAYAIFFEYTQEGLLRHPRHGLVHEWALKKLAMVHGIKSGKIISVFLNDGADVVALQSGRPMMTSQGFSDFDGIMSPTGCGTIDTAIVFQLFSAGYSSEGIYRILSQDSGFKALVDKKLARDIFSYQLIKTIGAGIAVLGGVDAVVFIGGNQKEIRHWACRLVRSMKFLGSPSIKTYYFKFDKWPLLSQLLQNV